MKQFRERPSVTFKVADRMVTFTYNPQTNNCKIRWWPRPLPPESEWTESERAARLPQWREGVLAYRREIKRFEVGIAEKKLHKMMRKMA